MIGSPCKDILCDNPLVIQLTPPLNSWAFNFKDEYLSCNSLLSQKKKRKKYGETLLRNHPWSHVLWFFFPESGLWGLLRAQTSPCRQTEKNGRISSRSYFIWNNFCYYSEGSRKQNKTINVTISQVFLEQLYFKALVKRQKNRERLSLEARITTCEQLSLH